MFKDPTLYAGGPYTADFVNLMEASVAENLMNVELERQELYGLPAAVLAAVQQNEVDIAVLMDQIAMARTQIEAGGLTPAQIVALEAGIAVWQQNIEDLNEYNATAIANVDTAREVEAQLLESETGLIASTELIEQNAREVNEIYLNTIGQSGEDLEFDASQAATLLSIAGQCPLVGGNPVYQARSLYSLIDEDAEFDDALICIVDGYVVKNLEVAPPSVTVFPNPTRSGQLFFHVSGLDNEEEQGVIQLYNVHGELVAQLGFNGRNGSLDVSGLAQGVYHWSLRVGDALIHQGKVTIL